MKKGLVFSLILLLSSCAPFVCKEVEALKKSYLMKDAPSSYEANLSVRYGFFRASVYLQKQEGEYIVSSEGGYVRLNLDKLCFGGLCLDVPLNPDEVLFGKVLKGDEEVKCSTASVSFERQEGSVKTRYVFRDGKLSQIELYDSKKDASLRLNYMEWSKEGYAKAIKVEKEEISLLIIVNSLKF